MRTTTRTRAYEAGTGGKARAAVRYPWHKLVKPGDWFLWKLPPRKTARDPADLSLRATAYKQQQRRGMVLSTKRTAKGMIVTLVGFDWSKKCL